MKLARDKGFERLVKLEKGKTSGRITTIRQRHLASMKIHMDSVKETDSTTWTVKSSQGGQWYTVTQEQQNCPINCRILCTECSICVHNYNCNCPDALIHSTICKHIHLVVRYQHTHTPSPCGDARTPLSHTPIQTDTTVLLHTLQKDTERNLFNVKDRMYKRLRVLGALVTQCNNRETLLAAEKFLNSAKYAIKAMSTVPNTFLQLQPHGPSNEHIPRQRSFYSTKKRRKTPVVAKPTNEEKEQICSTLLQRNPLYISYKGGRQEIPRELRSE